MKSNYTKNGYIKDIYIELPFYKYLHGPVEISDREDEIRFLGRKRIRDRLLNILKNGKTSGAYLVTGYRGMGKTSYVNRVLKDYDPDKNNSTVINICLNQNDIKLRDVYRQILNSLKVELYSPSYEYFQGGKLFSLIFSIVSFLFIITISFAWFYGFYIDLQKLNSSYFEAALTMIILIVFISFLVYQVLVFFRKRRAQKNIILTRIMDLIERTSGEVTKETGAQAAGNKFPIGFIDRRTNRLPIATTKEIEQELISIIQKYNEKLKKNLIFVFDELDKVENLPTETDYHEELDSQAKKNYKFDTIYGKDQRRLIIEILGGLKHFVTRAPARFIFIAGREMFDAALADINDRKSSISSIFHQIINVDSFLRDKSYKNTKGITNLIEEYLKEILLPHNYFKEVKKNANPQKRSLLKFYFELLDKYPEASRQKIIFALQNLMIYLTYRSNGAPHKLNALIEDLIVNYPSKDSWKYILVKRGDLKYSEEIKDPISTKRWYYPFFSFFSKEKQKEKPELYLRISYSNQYRHSFIAYMYRPFILTFSQYLKQYSDKVLYSTPYLMDHLIKFHPFAFSIQSLELLPEFLSNNRQPITRFFTQELISFLRQNLLREIEMGLFQFKYFKKVSNEIEYISKTFENDSAAFNFTRDENYTIKLQIRRRIKELRSIYKSFLEKTNYKNIYSITYLNILLGDAHFYDQEYNESIVGYQDALHNLKALSGGDQSIEDLILSIRLNLKIGLSFEKIKSYEYSLAHYSKAVEIVKSFFFHWDKEEIKINTQERFKFQAPSLFGELLEICLQCFLAKLYIQEKISAEGVNINKVLYMQRALLDLITTSRKITKNRNKFVLANFHLNIGTLFFFKNPSYTKNDLKSFFNEEQISYVSEYREELKPIHEIYGYDISPYAYISYKISLTSLLRTNSQELPQLLKRASDIIQKNHSYLKGGKPHRYIFSKVELKNIATSLTKIGDVLLSFLPTHDSKQKNSFTQCSINDVFGLDFKSIKKIDDISLFDIDRNLLSYSTGEDIFTLSFLIKTFYLSAKYYLEAEISVSASFQLRKILHIIRLGVDIKRSPRTDKFLFILENLFLSKILSITSYNSNSSDRPQIDKYKYYFGEIEFHHSPKSTKNIYKNISNSPEIKEALLFYCSISVRNWKFPDFNSDNKVKDFDEKVFILNEAYFREQSLINRYNSISSQFTRILELSFQNTMNYSIFENFVIKTLKLRNIEFIKAWENSIFDKYKSAIEEERKKILEKNIFSFISSSSNNSDTTSIIKLSLERYSELTCNSIYCLYEAIKIINICGIKYMLSYSYLGNFHRRLGKWLKHFALCIELKNNNIIEFSPREELVKLIGADALRTLDPTSQFQLALQNFKRAIQLHSQGKTYYKQIGDLIYLEDGYNDNLNHYCAAIERQQINSGKIEYYIKDLNKKIDNSQLLKIDRYLNNL